MKGFFSRILTIFLVLIAICFIAVFLLNSKLPGFISNKLSKALKVPVKIEDIHISYNNITLNDLEISNPPKSVLPTAFSSKSISFD
ncbi:MAG: hypothetical protein JSS09_01915, partial [Verrucomicrobia bacterium]|nr:hypothetical protein [Verrucomicrobiota bacterium]